MKDSIGHKERLMRKEAERINRFYAVTVDALYLVGVESGEPFVVEMRAQPSGKIRSGGKLESGAVVLVSVAGLCTAARVGEGETEIAFDKTKPVVALFTDEAETVRCFDAKNLQPFDPRWFRETKRVITTIGNAHPYFLIRSDKSRNIEVSFADLLHIQ